MKLYTAILVAAAAVIAAATFLLTARDTSRPATERSLLGREGTLTTSRESLDAVIASARERVAADPGDGQAAVLLADALMRAARVNADASLALEAERVLKTTLTHGPDDYVAARMLGVVLLSQHRFAQALDAARQAQKQRPEDAWNYAVAGDALLELGRYQEAFDSFDAAAARRPDAGVYARIAYARELQGDVDGAIRIMRMAVEATGAHDPEAQAWTLAQVGSLLLLQRRLDDAEREFARAAYVFPGHPYVEAGRMRLRIAQRRYQEALAIAEAAPETPESLAVRGDLLARLKLRAEAEAAYTKAERLEREGWATEEPQPAALARFFAERNRKLPEAVALAERAAADRQDIHTLDALAWAYFRAGRIDEASAAIERAVKVGTVDPRIRCHASAIAAAKAGRLPRHGEVCDPLEPNPIPIDGRMADAGHAGTAATVTVLLGSGTGTKAAVHRSDLLLGASDRVYSPRVASGSRGGRNGTETGRRRVASGSGGAIAAAGADSRAARVHVD